MSGVKKIIIGLLLAGWFMVPESAHGMGLGVCHQVKQGGTSWGYNGADTIGWSNIEPARGVFNWSQIDADVTQARSENRKIWIQIMAPNYVPQWAVNLGVEVINNRRNNPVPVIWNKKYRQYYGEAIKAMAERYDREEYLDVIEAVIIMAGGTYGEMNLDPGKCAGEPGADVLNPNNVFVQSIAREYGLSPSEVAQSHDCLFQGREYVCYRFDDLFIDAAQKNIDMYLTYFKKLPLVLQGGSSLSCQTKVSVDILEYTTCRYGDRVWAKFNGWEPGGPGLGSGGDFTRGGLEPGHPDLFSRTYWREYGVGNTTAEKEAYGQRQVAGAARQALNGRYSYICLQSDFFIHPNEYYLSGGIEGWSFDGLRNALASAPDPIPKVLEECQAFPCLGGVGNLDCSSDRAGLVNESDLAVLLNNWGNSEEGDLNKDEQVDGQDLEALLSFWSPQETQFTLLPACPQGYPVFDSYISAENDNKNYGSAARLELGRWSTIAFGKALFKIDLSSISQAAVITSAQLSLCFDRGNKVSLFALKKDWLESGVTWNQAKNGASWESGGIDGPTDRELVPMAEIETNRAGIVKVDLTDRVRAWISHPESNFGFLLVPQLAGTGLVVTSKEGENARCRPCLTITF